MSNRPIILAIAGIIALSLIVMLPLNTAHAQQAKPKVQKWEYKQLRLSNSDIGQAAVEQALNELGDQGWELVDIPGYMFFKRPKN